MADDNAPGGAAAWRDALVLAAIVAIPAAFYAPDLGFYLDDWGFWSWMRGSPDQSLPGLYRALYRNLNLSVRPGQIVWLIAGYKVSALHAWPIHLANHLLFGAGLLVFHAALRSVPRWRSAAFPISLIYGSLATFVSVKMWWASQQATLSWFFFAFTLWLVARSKSSTRPALLALGTTATAVAGGLCYEFFTPFAPLLPAFVWSGWGRSWREAIADLRFALMTTAGVAAVILVTLYKWSIHEGFGALASGRHHPADLAMGIGRMYVDMARDSLWTAGLATPLAAVRTSLGPHFGPLAIPAGATTMALLLARLRPWQAEATKHNNQSPSPLIFAGIGATTFVVGYAALWPNLYYLPGTWGPNNRVSHAAALGVAFIIFAGYLAIGRRWPRAALWALLMFCVAGVFMQVSIGRTWVKAKGEQRAVLSQVHAVAPRLPQGKALLVYGLCPYIGPGPVFPYRGWDLTQALHLDGLPGLNADLLTPGTVLDGMGLVVADPVSHDKVRYPYGSFAVLDHASGTAAAIDSRESAKRFFATRSLALPTGCSYHKGAGAALY